MGRPVIITAASRAALGICVPTQISHLSGFTETTQLCGSIGACERYGASYVASNEVRRSDTGLLVFNATAPGFSRRSANILCIVALEVFARAPSFHWTFSALRPCMADQVLSATTATPFEICTTC